MTDKPNRTREACACVLAWALFLATCTAILSACWFAVWQAARIDQSAGTVLLWPTVPVAVLAAIVGCRAAWRAWR